MSNIEIDIEKIIKKIKSKTDWMDHKPDPYAKEKLSEVFTGMSGRYSRLKIIELLAEEPLNIFQLSKKLGVEYKGVQHNIKVLEQNNMISKVGGKYGGIYFLSTFLEKNIGELEKIIKKVETKLSSKKVYL
jgi:predicted transcriptional regulator